jgi:hypothetical protein
LLSSYFSGIFGELILTLGILLVITGLAVHARNAGITKTKLSFVSISYGRIILGVVAIIYFFDLLVGVPAVTGELQTYLAAAT